MKVKNLIAILFVAVFVASCSTVKQSARMESPATYINTATVADLEVSETAITFTYEPSNAVCNGGYENVIKTAVSEALKKHGDYDVLVGLQYTIKQNFFGKIKIITVKGYPAKYKNFRNLPDSIWYKTPLFKQPVNNSTKVWTSIFNK